MASYNLDLLQYLLATDPDEAARQLAAYAAANEAPAELSPFISQAAIDAPEIFAEVKAMQIISPEEYEAKYFDPSNFDHTAVMNLFGWEHVLANAYHHFAGLKLAVAEGRNTPENAELQFAGYSEPIFKRFGVPYTNPWAGASTGTEYAEPLAQQQIANEVYSASNIVREAGVNSGVDLQTIEQTIVRAQNIVAETGASAVEAAKTAAAEIMPAETAQTFTQSLAGIIPGGGGSLLLWAGLGLAAFLIFRKRS